jgi:metallo-beta-lactamase class B
MYNPTIYMGKLDWDVMMAAGEGLRRGEDVLDGQKLTLGDTTLELYLTPGHTFGTVSTLIPVRDGGARHVAALWGGTLFNFGPDAERFTAYAESAARFLDIAQRAGVDVLLSNHTDYDGTKEKLPALAARAPGAPHPYVVGADSVERYLTVAHECALAALASLDE